MKKEPDAVDMVMAKAKEAIKGGVILPLVVFEHGKPIECTVPVDVAVKQAKAKVDNGTLDCAMVVQCDTKIMLPDGQQTDGISAICINPDNDLTVWVTTYKLENGRWLFSDIIGMIYNGVIQPDLN